MNCWAFSQLLWTSYVHVLYVNFLFSYDMVWPTFGREFDTFGGERRCPPGIPLVWLAELHIWTQQQFVFNYGKSHVIFWNVLEEDAVCKEVQGTYIAFECAAHWILTLYRDLLHVGTICVLHWVWCKLQITWYQCAPLKFVDWPVFILRHY